MESYGEGFRTFEVDFVMSKDGIPLAAHDLQEKNYYGLDGVFSDYTAQEFLDSKLKGGGTTLAGPQIIQLLHNYPDIQIIMDVKVADQASLIKWFLDRLPETEWPRLLTNLRSEKQIQNLYSYHPGYRGIFLQVGPWREDMVFTDEQIRDMVVQYNLAGVFTWIDELDPNLDYISNNTAHKRWTPTLEKYMIESGKSMIWHTSDDPVLIALRQSQGGAIITNTAIPTQSSHSLIVNKTIPLHVLIISIDGLRPDAIFQAPMPNLIALMQTSAYTLNAQTIFPSLTLPSHTSMLTGLCPAQLGTILLTLDKYNFRKSTLIIVTADHGGHATTHGTNRPDDMTIPWIINGPSVTPMQLATNVNTTDTAATIAWALNLDIPNEWDGSPVLEAFGIADEPHMQPRCP